MPIHRDLQSANIMVAGGEPFLIDFQGMRPGCAAYDLGSLLYDPYREHPAERRERFWRLYREEVAALGGTPPADDVFHVASVQRLLQVLGAYGKLWLDDGLEWYRRFIMPGLRLLGEAATAGGRPEIARVAAAASRLAETKGIDNRKERA